MPPVIIIMKLLAILIVFALIASPAFGQAVGRVILEIPPLEGETAAVPNEAPPESPQPAQVITGAAIADEPILEPTGEVTLPPPVIAAEPQEQLAIPLVTQQRAEKPNEVIGAVRDFWNHFFGFIWTF